MGRKTMGNDLDNASIAFNNVKIPKSALLDKYCTIENNAYVAKVKGIQPMQMIGQRLFSGRVAVAYAANEFGKALFKMTRSYSDAKACWAPGTTVPLGNIPQLRSIYAE